MRLAALYTLSLHDALPIFSGEINILAGRRPVATVRVTEAGEVIEMQREALLALVQTDAELSEILMRAFILRRAMLLDRKSTRLNSSHVEISYAVVCLKKKS